MLLIYISNLLRSVKRELINRLQSPPLILYQIYQNIFDRITDLSFHNKDIEKNMISIKRFDNKKLNMTMKLLILFYNIYFIL